jgi:uncharacterized delta-60 repeat protein
MYFSSWLRNRVSKPRIKRATAVGPKPTRFRPSLEFLEDRCVPSAGFLDPTFNTTGVVTTQVAPLPYDNAVAVYPSGTANAGKIVSVGGVAESPDNGDFGLVRYNSNGSLDPIFGNGGIVNQVLTGNDVANAVALVGDKILASGTAYKKTTSDFEVARFNSDGSLDQTFGSKGSIQTQFGKQSDGADAGAMAVQADGKIVVAGIADVPRNHQVYLEFAVARYTPNGTLDTTFGNNGKMTIDVGASLNNPIASAGKQTLALSGNSIDLVGHGQYSQNVYVAQLTAAGQLDPNFGSGGAVNLGQGFDPSLTVQPDGKLVVVSNAAGSAAGIDVTRLLANGSPDTGFGTGGTATVPLSANRTFYSTAAQVDPLGRFVIGGFQGRNSTNSPLMIIRLTPTGALDTTFGVGGIGTSGNLVALYGTPTISMTLQPDGKTVLVSTTNDGKFAAARFTGDSALSAASLPQHATLASGTSAEAQPAATSAGAGDSLYIGDGNDNTVKQFDATTGAYEGTFVASGSGGLLGPRGLIFGESHDLLVVNQNVFTTGIGGEVLRYDGQTGAFINKVVADTDPHNPYDPRGMVRGPHHSLFVGDLGDLGNLDGTGRPGRLAQFDEKTGAWIRDLSPTVPFTTDNGPRGVVIGPDGLLYVAVRNFNPLGGEVMRFNPATGAFLGDFVDSDPTNDLNRPEGLVFGPDGNLYVTSFQANASDTDKILEFNGTTGAYLGKIDLDQVGQPRAFAQALLFGPDGKLFVPITGNGPDTGEVRRYDLSTGTFTVFVPPSGTGGLLGMPWYLTFGQTDPATLAYNTKPGAKTGQGQSASVPVVAAALTAAAATAGPVSAGPASAADFVEALPAMPADASGFVPSSAEDRWTGPGVRLPNQALVSAPAGEDARPPSAPRSLSWTWVPPSSHEVLDPVFGDLPDGLLQDTLTALAKI